MEQKRHWQKWIKSNDKPKCHVMSCAASVLMLHQLCKCWIVNKNHDREKLDFKISLKTTLFDQWLFQSTLEWASIPRNTALQCKSHYEFFFLWRVKILWCIYFEIILIADIMFTLAKCTFVELSDVGTRCCRTVEKSCGI